MDKNKLAAIAALLKSCDQSELEEIAAMIGGMLEATAEAEEPQKESHRGSARGSRGGRGYIEMKFIPDGNKSYGPYAYLRYWHQGKHKSLYLGKQNED